MLEERPPAELPARASAIAGAKARVAAIRTASRMRQFSIRFDMVRSSKRSRGTARILTIWARAHTGGRIARRVERFLGEGASSRAAGNAGERAGLLDCRARWSQIFCLVHGGVTGAERVRRPHSL